MPRISAYTKFCNEHPEKIENLIKEVTKLYLEENLTQKEISALYPSVDFNVIRHITYYLNKPKELHYKKIAENSAKTNIERYGVSCTLNTEDSIKKKKETWLRNYGVDNPSKSEKIKQRKIQTSKDHYGTDYPLQSEEIKNQIIQTNLQKYGTRYPIQSETVKSYHKGLTNQREQIPQEVREILYNKDKFIKLLNQINPKSLTIRTICEKLNYYGATTVNRQFHKFELNKLYRINFYRSYGETEIIDFIDSIYSGQVEINDRRSIHPYELDIYIPEFKFGIEFNGNYWHSSETKDLMYHQNKSLYAKDKGIFIYHIFEYEWNDSHKQEVIKSQLRNLLHKNESIIFARNCEIREVDSCCSRQFLELNHLQGNRNSSIKLGLYYNNELVSLMTFGKNKFIRKNDSDNTIELLRFCNKTNISVVGGASKLFKYFLNNYSYNEIISYCNLSKGRGDLYYKLGMKMVSVTPPNYIWINYKTGEYKTRYQTQMKNEEQIMTEDGYVKISDCGSYKFIFKKEVIL